MSRGWTKRVRGSLLRSASRAVRAQAVLFALRSASDVRTAVRFLKLKYGYRKRQFVAGPPTALRFKELAGRSIWIRPGTSDVQVARETLMETYHLPLGDIGEPRTILDRGANIGITVAHFATTYPAARILGVELDYDNAQLAGTHRGELVSPGERAAWGCVDAQRGGAVCGGARGRIRLSGCLGCDRQSPRV
jgi:hypothetical protein